MLRRDPSLPIVLITSASTIQIDVWCIKFNSTAANCCRSRAPRGWLPSSALPANGTNTSALHPTGPAASQCLAELQRSQPRMSTTSMSRERPPLHPNPVSGQRDPCLVLMRRLRHREGTKVTSCAEVGDDTTTAKPKSPRPLPTMTPPPSVGEGKESALANADPLWICQNY